MALAQLTRKVKPVCEHCKSSDVRFEAFVDWSIGQQTFRIKETTNNCVCAECGKESKPSWVLA